MTEEPKVSASASMGEAAYRAYIAERGGKTISGAPAPAWAELPRDIQTAWEVGAEASRDWLLQARGWSVLMDAITEAERQEAVAADEGKDMLDALRARDLIQGSRVGGFVFRSERDGWLSMAGTALAALRALGRGSR